MSLIEDAQRRHQLAAKIGAAPPVIGQGGERGNRRKITGKPAEVALEPPQRHNDAGLDIVAPRNRIEQNPILSQLTPCILLTLRGHHLGDVLGERHRPLGLLAVELDDAGKELRIAKRGIDGRRADAVANGGEPHPGKKSREIPFRGAC